MVDRIGVIIAFLIFAAILVPIMMLFKIFGTLHSKFIQWYDSIYYSFFWNSTFRYLLESYTPIMQVSVERIYNGLIWSTPLLVLLTAFNVVNLVIYSIAPLIITIYFRKNLRLF